MGPVFPVYVFLNNTTKIFSAVVPVDHEDLHIFMQHRAGVLLPSIFLDKYRGKMINAESKEELYRKIEEHCIRIDPYYKKNNMSVYTGVMIAVIFLLFSLYLYIR